jgi:hydroxymethylpyrimidine/phosphomethylpyrimidine kinase
MVRTWFGRNLTAAAPTAAAVVLLHRETDGAGGLTPGKEEQVKKALTIAGSDSGGGAGIQADLKTFAALGVYGMSALTAVTAQNTVGVHGAVELPPEFVGRQIDAVMQDIGADAVKTGMLSSAAIVRVVAAKVREYKITNLVIDPVMVAKGGDLLLQESAVGALRDELLPLGKVVTPNLGEAEVLTGMKISNLEDMKKAAEILHKFGTEYVVVKGGHLEGDAVDLLFDGQEFTTFPGERIVTKNTHGTGCTFAAAVAAGLARGAAVPAAVGRAKNYIGTAIRHALAIGAGHGPTHHFAELYEAAGITMRDE